MIGLIEESTQDSSKVTKAAQSTKDIATTIIVVTAGEVVAGRVVVGKVIAGEAIAEEVIAINLQTREVVAMDGNIKTIVIVTKQLLLNTKVVAQTKLIVAPIKRVAQ